MIGPEGKGARFAANSPKNRFCEKNSEKFCERVSGGQIRLEMGSTGCEGYINLLLRFM